MSDHASREHRYVALSDAIENEKIFIGKLMDKVQQREPLVRQAIQTVKEVENKLNTKAKTAKAEINKCYPKLIEALQERHKHMLSEVDKMYHGKSKVLSSQQRRLEVDMDNMLNTCKVTGKLLVKCDQHVMSSRTLHDWGKLFL